MGPLFCSSYDRHHNIHGRHFLLDAWLGYGWAIPKSTLLLSYELAVLPIYVHQEYSFGGRNSLEWPQQCAQSISLGDSASQLTRLWILQPSNTMGVLVMIWRMIDYDGSTLSGWSTANWRVKRKILGGVPCISQSIQLFEHANFYVENRTSQSTFRG